MFSLLALFDDIATTFDDVAVMTKIAMKKTGALMSDDLAVNAGVVDGVTPDRELPMVRSIFLGSLLNKIYGIVGVLGISAVYPPLLTAILLIGGLFLSYEGAHKVIEKFTGSKTESDKESLDEAQKVKGAIRTDLILSIEIILIANSSLSGTLLERSLPLTLVGLGASIIIYGLVAVLVKIDDFGLYLIRKEQKKIGSALVSMMPFLMKGLGIIGTIAMFLVGGGIISHTFHLKAYAPELLQHLVLGVVAGLICSFAIQIFTSFRK